MASAISKITLSSSRDIPFHKLTLSQSNVRRVKADLSIEQLAESIARRGLIQSLHVRPVHDADGKETGMFEVPAGGRRFCALELLVKQKRLARTAPIPCIVGDAASGIMIDEISLAENIDRAPLHPLDQFRAFLGLRDKGMTEEAIAAAFFVGVNVVKQRLRLAAVSPVLLAIYAEDGMTLEMLMAFTVSNDTARQEQVWAAIKDTWQKEPYQIRRMLTETTVRASDKRAIFVGIEAYEAAGGAVTRDLFLSDDGGWLQDVALLDRLVAEKLTTVANEIAAEGWKWVEADLNLPYDAGRGMRVISGTPCHMTQDDEARRDNLQAEYDRISETCGGEDDLPEELDQRLAEIEAALEDLDNRPMCYDPADMAIAGVFITVERGKLSFHRGYVRPEDEPAAAADAHGGEAADSASVPIATPVGSKPIVSKPVVTITGPGALATEEDEEDCLKPLPERLVIELTAHRTLALRDAVASHPHVAMTALLHKLVSDTFLHHALTGAIEVSVKPVNFPAQAEDLKDSATAQSMAQQKAQWVIPTGDDDLWDWLAALDDATRMELLAHCVSYGVNALHERPNPYGSGVTQHGLDVRLAQADRLARATGLDMAKAGWKPTVANYLGRVTKTGILAAVREGAGPRAAQLIDHMKKGDMAREAERLLADTGWLPEPLRLAGTDDSNPINADDQATDEALPAFLSDDADEEASSDLDDEEDHTMIAAE